jgi:hypothetical protein
VGRNPPKNLSKSASLKDYLKTQDPVKLAKIKESIRQERAVSEALERYEPSAEEEVQDIVKGIAETTGQLPSEEEVEDIKVEVLLDRKKRGVKAGSKRGPYLGKLEGQDIDKTMAQKKLIKGMKALIANIDRSKFNRALKAQKARQSAIEFGSPDFPPSGAITYSSAQAQQDAEDEAWAKAQLAAAESRRLGEVANPSVQLGFSDVPRFTAPGWED